jgi:hypothetical protein
MTLEIRKDLSADGLFRKVKEYLGRILDHRKGDIEISLGDCLMSVFAMFSLKHPSLLKFMDEMYANENMRTIYQIEEVPSDTRMREILDEVDPFSLSKAFRVIFAVAQRGKVLEKMVYHEGYYIIAGDGTGYFSSQTVHCENCLEKNSSNGVTYYHQMYCMAIVKPGEKAVIPLMPEPIIKQDGNTKNDCERNAAKRALERLRLEHPHLKILFTEDGLSSNAPHIKDLIRLKIEYLLIAKEGDHQFLFNYVESKRQVGEVKTVTVKQENGVNKLYKFINDVPLNASNVELRVNFLEYWEIDTNSDKVLRFAWVTSVHLKEENVEWLVEAGRSRWKIENETFNTLKNQGYHFEHNFGHGNKNLSVVFAFLMMLAFLVDQLQQLACGLFQAVLVFQQFPKAYETLDFIECNKFPFVNFFCNGSSQY